MTRRPPRRITLGHPVGSKSVVIAAVVVTVGGLVGACSPSGDEPAPGPGVEASTRSDNPEPMPTPSVTPTPSVWSGALERGPLGVAHQGRTFRDPRDAAATWVDIKGVTFGGNVQPSWTLRLQARPPRAARLEPGRLIGYGLVVNTNGDDAADYVIGIDNAAPDRGDFHVWVTDLATGETREQVGPPYGFPVEFAHPDESHPGEAYVPRMLFTFLTGSAPPGVDSSAQFYAWAAESRKGEIVALDYAPDGGWMEQ